MRYKVHFPASFCRPTGNQTPAMPFTGWTVAPAPYWPTSAKSRTFVPLLLEGLEPALRGTRGPTPAQRRYRHLRVATKFWSHQFTSSGNDHMQAEIRATLSPLYQAIGNHTSPAINFIRTRVESTSERWIRAGLKMRGSSNKTIPNRMRVKATSHLHRWSWFFLYDWLKFLTWCSGQHCGLTVRGLWLWLSLWSLNVQPTSVWVFSGFSGLLPQSTKMHVRQNWEP